MKDFDVWRTNCETKPWNLQRVGPHGHTPPGAAFANVAKEEAQKGISSADRSQAQAIENEIGSIDQAVAKLLNPSLWDQRQERIRALSDVEERMELNTIFERDKAAIPKVHAQLELDHTILVRKLVPFAIKVLKLVCARLPKDIADADVSTERHCEFFGISQAGSSDWLVWPIQRLLQGVMSQLHFLESGSEVELMHVRRVLVDAGVISPKTRV